MNTEARTTFRDELNDLHALGFTLLREVYCSQQVDSFLQVVNDRLSQDSEGIKSLRGETYAARNVFELIPESLDFWQTTKLTDFLVDSLGNEFGLVRGLYFDKHPNRTWSLGWHKDMTIAVKDNSLPSDNFSKPTRKSDIPHVEGSEEVLSNMVTLRIHLDDVTDENGPLEVIPKSHLSGKETAASPEQVVKVKCQRGDVLAMRPLLSHASGSSTPGTTRHRRILHLEFAHSSRLPDGYQWNDFVRPG